MFGLFKKTDQQLAVEELKRLRNRIEEAGGSAQLCYRYWQFLEGNELHRAVGVAPADQAPFPAMLATLSALDLLNAWKSTPDSVGQDTKEAMLLLAERVYVSAVTSLDNQQLSRLFNEVGGESASETAARETADARLRDEIAKRKATAIDAWAKWKASDFDLLEAIRTA